MKLRIQVVIEPDEGRYHAYCPALKGLHVDGETEEEALKNADTAVRAYLESLAKHDEPIPVGIIEREPVVGSGWFSGLFSSGKEQRRVEELLIAA